MFPSGEVEDESRNAKFAYRVGKKNQLGEEDKKLKKQLDEKEKAVRKEMYEIT